MREEGEPDREEEAFVAELYDGVLWTQWRRDMSVSGTDAFLLVQQAFWDRHLLRRGGGGSEGRLSSVATVSEIRIGTSGWSYDHWNDVCYPQGTPPAKRLDHYAARFDTVELNASFYRWPRDTTFAGWRRRFPPGFALTVKAPRGLTHGKKLYAPEVWIERIAHCWHELGGRRAVLLVQLPPAMERDDARLDYFLSRVPGWIRVAVEFRHPSWDDDAVYGLLARHQAAYCVMSGAGLPCILRATAPFVYVRLHGPDHEHLYAGSYSDADLHWWADRVLEWHGAGRDVYVYFNNDGGGNAVRNAQTLQALVRASGLPTRN